MNEKNKFAHADGRPKTHSALPWQINELDERVIRRVGKRSEMPNAGVLGQTFDEGIDAAFIVMACNAHYALVEEKEKLKEALMQVREIVCGDSSKGAMDVLEVVQPVLHPYDDDPPGTPEEPGVCPRCGEKAMNEVACRNSLSRYRKGQYICDPCGTDEAFVGKDIPTWFIDKKEPYEKPAIRAGTPRKEGA